VALGRRNEQLDAEDQATISQGHVTAASRHRIPGPALGNESLAFAISLA
jgi:hypothetical protein